jgi:hypothetical protein
MQDAYLKNCIKIMKEELRLRTPENKGEEITGGWRELCKKEPKNNHVIKCRGSVVRGMHRIRRSCRTSIRRPEDGKPLERPAFR